MRERRTWKIGTSRSSRIAFIASQVSRMDAVCCVLLVNMSKDNTVNTLYVVNALGCHSVSSDFRTGWSARVSTASSRHILVTCQGTVSSIHPTRICAVAIEISSIGKSPAEVMYSSRSERSIFGKHLCTHNLFHRSPSFARGSTTIVETRPFL
jgi:hypothetical protein